MRLPSTPIVLLALALPLAGCFSCDACETDGQARLAPVARALDAYRDDHGAYPDSVAALVPAYLRALPDEPEWLADNSAPDYAWRPESMDPDKLPRDRTRWWGYRSDSTSYLLGFMYVGPGISTCTTRDGRQWDCSGYI